MANRCDDCNKFVGLEFNDTFSAIELDVFADGTPKAEYTFDLDCYECGASLKTGTVEFEANDVPEEITEYVDNFVTEEKLEAAKEQAKEEYYIRKEKEGWPRSQVDAETTDDMWEQIEISAEAELYEHNFSIEESSFEVEKGKGRWIATLNVHINDDDNDDWPGIDYSMTTEIMNRDLEDY
jgi:hypothetical protein